jgi:hypothetical protein
MSSIDVPKFTSEELSKEKLKTLINNKESFQIVSITNMSAVVNRVEGAIETQSLSCRVYTEYRSASIAAAAIPSGLTQATGLISAIGIGLHNLATFNPDYELAKNIPTSTLTVTYKKQ